MSLFNSVIGSLSPKFRSSFEDPHAREHELPLYRSSSNSPRVPAPIASTVLWNTPPTSLSPPPRVPDDLLAIQRKARNLEHQLQELLDAQADGLMSGLSGAGTVPDDATSTGSVTPTVSSVRGSERGEDGSEAGSSRKREYIGLNAARRGIFRRIQQLANVKAEEMDLLDDDLRALHTIVERTERWVQKRTRLQRRIQDIESKNAGSRSESLREEASKLEQDIRQKEEELWALKARHRKVLNDLAETENSVEANLASYKSSLSILDKEVATFLARPPDTDHIPLAQSPFLSLPPKRRTLEMAQDYWAEEHTRLSEKCQEVDIERAALDDGAVFWNNVVKRVIDFEVNLQNHMLKAARNNNADPSKLLSQMEDTVAYLEGKMETASSRSWNLLVCAIGAELEAFKQGKEILDDTLGPSRKGKEKASKPLLDDESSATESDEVSRSAIRIVRSPPKPSIPPPKPTFFDTDNDDPDPELMISHQDTDTD